MTIFLDWRFLNIAKRSKNLAGLSLCELSSYHYFIPCGSPLWFSLTGSQKSCGTTAAFSRKSSVIYYGEKKASSTHMNVSASEPQHFPYNHSLHAEFCHAVFAETSSFYSYISGVRRKRLLRTCEWKPVCAAAFATAPIRWEQKAIKPLRFFATRSRIAFLRTR